MKHFGTLFICAAAALLSCQKAENEVAVEPVSSGLTMDNENDLSQVIDANGGTVTVSFTAGEDWTAQFVYAQDWASLSTNGGGAGHNSITVTLIANEDYDERSVTVRLTCKSDIKTVRITQKQRDALTLTASTIEADHKGGTYDVTVNANIEYSITVDSSCSDWIHLEQTKALSSTKYKLTVDPNEELSKREGSVTVSSGELSETIHIYQAGDVPGIVLSQNDYAFSYEATSFTVQVSHNVPVTCTVPMYASWITLDETKAMSCSKYTFSITQNSGDSIRDASIKFTNEENGLTEIVTVSQMFKEALVVSKSSYEVGADGRQITILLGHNVDFTIACPSWIEQVQTKSYLEDALEFMVQPTRMPDAREGSIVFTSTDGAVSQEVKVCQDGADWNNIPDDEMWYITKDGAKWELSGNGPLFDVDVISNTYEYGAGVLKLSAPPTKVMESGFFNNYSVLEWDFLTQIALPSSIRTIERLGLRSLEGIKNLVLPEGLEVIKDDAMICMTSLETVTLPSTLTSIGYNVFSTCPVKRFLGPSEFIIMDGMALSRDYNYRDVETGIDYSGRWLAKVSTDIVKAEIPDGLIAIESGAFKDALQLEELIVPSSVKRIGGDNFRSEKFHYIGGPDASADNRCYISYGELQAFASAGIKSYTTPDGVTSIGQMAFECCSELEELIINDEVTSIKMYAFGNCPKIKSITLPSSLEKMSYDPFYNNTTLESLYVRSIVPPSTDIIYTTEFPNLKIYVPDVSLGLYENSESWSKYRKYLTAKHYEGLKDPGFYFSTDFSAKGHVTCLQKASEGNGIDLVIMGDAFSDRQISDGTYGSWMNRAMESFFCVEPYKTYRKLFNVWSVDVVSGTEGFTHGGGALNTYFGSGTFINGDADIIKEYAFNAIDSTKIDNVTIIVVPNKEIYAGTCTMYKPSSTGGYAQGLSIGWVPINSNYETFSSTLNHEVGGHGFGKLQDEYFYAGSTPTQYDIDGYTGDKKNYGWYMNFDFTNSTLEVSWAHFLSDSRYASEELGIYEGALFQYGAYRPRESSIMVYNIGGYNAPSREIIYKRIMSLAYGSSWTYNYEDFVQYDQINIPQSTKTLKTGRKVPAPFRNEKDFIPLARPVLGN